MYFGFENITVGYGKKTVIESLTLDVPKGKILTVIGQNGCGKTTLLKTVSRVLTPTSGCVVLDDRPLYSYRTAELAKRIAYLAQFSLVPADTDVQTLVSYGRYPHMKLAGCMTKSDKIACERAMVLTGTDTLASHRLSSLSGGELQRVRIAMTVAQEADILVLDEPVTHLDIGHRLEVAELLKKLTRELNITVLCVLHDINMAARYSDILCAIKNAKICALGTPKEILTKENIANIFGIDANILWDTEHDCPYYIANVKGE